MLRDGTLSLSLRSLLPPSLRPRLSLFLFLSHSPSLFLSASRHASNPPVTRFRLISPATDLGPRLGRAEAPQRLLRRATAARAFLARGSNSRGATTSEAVSSRTPRSAAVLRASAEHGALLLHLFVSPNNTIYCVVHDGDVYTHECTRVLSYACKNKHRHSPARARHTHTRAHTPSHVRAGARAEEQR